MDGSRAHALLQLAARALDPNGLQAGPRPDVARDLLAEAARLALGAGSTTEAEDPSSPPLDLERARRAGLGPQDQDALRALLAGEPADLPRAEIAVALLLEERQGRTPLRAALRRRVWVARAAAVAAALAVVVVVLSLARELRPSDAYRWTASSAEPLFETEGVLGDHGPWELVFHTKAEQAPWVKIDLGAERVIREITLRQRTDCCTDRGLPLLVETSLDGVDFDLVEKRREPFREWTLRFGERRARWVRLRSTGRTILHYRDVAIR